jgi:hypothetical protein
MEVDGTLKEMNNKIMNTVDRKLFCSFDIKLLCRLLVSHTKCKWQHITVEVFYPFSLEISCLIRVRRPFLGFLPPLGGRFTETICSIEHS